MDHSTNIAEDDGSIYREINGFKHEILLGSQAAPCSKVETHSLNNIKYGRNNTVQSIWLESDQQIKPENVSRALFLVSRQVPHLQFCFMKEGSKFYFKRIAKLEIDFETCSKDPLEMHYEMWKASYDILKGPLWKVRLNLHIPDAKRSNKKYSAFLTLGVHHSITDVTTNMKICRDLISILNKISLGEEIVPVFSPVCPNMDDATTGMRSKSYLVKTVCKKLIQAAKVNFADETSFHGALPSPKTKSIEPRVIFTDLSKCETETLFKLCKEAEVTVNSFITVAANFALMAIAQSRSKSPIGPRKIFTVHAVNLRRYYEPQYKDSSGFHSSFLEEISQMESSDINNFWLLARKTHINIKRKLEISKEPVKNIPLVPLAFKILAKNHLLNSKGYRNRNACHYSLSNMGNLADMLPGPEGGEDIEITYILRSAGNPYSPCLFALIFQTFRERLLISVDYSDNTMQDQIAQEFLDSLMLNIRMLIKTNIIN